MKNFIFICLLLAWMHNSLFSLTEDKTVKFEHISSEYGLAQNTVRCILQDSKGFMWFGTQDGLSRYDGYKFITYKQEPNNSDSLINNEINALCEDNSGMLWIGTIGGGFTRYDMKKESFHRYPNDPKGINHKTISAICRDRNDALWIGTLGGGLIQLIREPGKPETFIHYRKIPGDPNSLGGDLISSITEDRAGVIWVGLFDNGLAKFNRDKGTFTTLHTINGDTNNLDRDIVNKIFEDRSGKLWIGTLNNGIIKWDRKSGMSQHYRMNPDETTNPNSLSSNIVTDICQDRSGTLWVGTRDGLNRFDEQTGTFSHYRKIPGNMNSLGHNHILSLCGDWSDVLWIGTNKSGLDKLHREIKFKYYAGDPDEPAKQDEYSVFAILEDRSGLLWIGTDTNGLDMYNRKTGSYTHYRQEPGNPNGLSSNSIRALHEDQSGAIWIGTHRGGGINILDKKTGKFQHYMANPEVPGSVSSNIILCFYQAMDGTLWIGTFEGGLNKFNPDTKTFTHYKKIENNPNSLSGNIVPAIYEAPSEPGILWIGTGYSGLNRFDTHNNTFERFSTEPDNPDSLSYNTVLSILEDRSGVLWATTYGGGLNKVIRKQGEKIKFVHYTEKDGLCNNSIYGMLEDAHGNLWLSTNKGISRFDPKTGISRSYTVSDGLQGHEYNGGAYFKSKSGEMFFGGPNGFNTFYPSEVKDNPHIPPIVFSGFKLFNQCSHVNEVSPLQNSITSTESLELSYRQNIFSIEFSAMDFTIPEKNQYAYMIEGYHSQWIDLGHAREINIIGLTPGEYTLKVKGTNNDGVWNEEGTSLGIIITPPFWQTWWFRALCVLIVVAGLIIWHRKRMERLSLRLKTESELNRIYENYNISNREKDILHLILKGKTNKDIEDELYISVKTVKNHVYNIYQKLGVKTRLELIHRIQKSARLN